MYYRAIVGKCSDISPTNARMQEIVTLAVAAMKVMMIMQLFQRTKLPLLLRKRGEEEIEGEKGGKSKERRTLLPKGNVRFQNDFIFKISRCHVVIHCCIQW